MIGERREQVERLGKNVAAPGQVADSAARRRGIAAAHVDSEACSRPARALSVSRAGRRFSILA
jgi:hypothetical protein